VTPSIAIETARRSGVRVVIADRAWIVAVGIGVVCWTAALFEIARDRYANFRFARYDLGNMVQAVWSTAHGRPLEQTNGYTGEELSRLSGHVDPILAALAPLWIVAPSPVTLIAVQIVAVALGAVPLFLLGRRHLGARPAALVALAYLAYPWVAWTAVDAFHPVTLAIPLFLTCVWALDADRLVPFVVAAVFAAATGELMALPIAGLGIWYAFARGRRVAGVVIAAASIAWVGIALRVVVPHFSGGDSPFYGVYREIGSTPFGVARTALTDPSRIVVAATHGSDFLYVILLALPVGGLFVLAPGMAAVALPQLSANVLAGIDWTTDPHSHYIAGIVPFLFAAICLGLASRPPERRMRLALLVLTVSLASSVMAGPWPGAVGVPASYRTQPSPEHLSALRAAVALVPDDAPVTATSTVGGRLSARRYIYTVPVLGRAEWVVLDRADAWMPQAVGGYSDAPRLRALEAFLNRSPRWTRVFERDGVLVFRKVDS